MRHPTKDDCFRTLKAIDVPIGSILDVGVKTCAYELRRAFPDLHHVLMEPIVEYNDEMKKNYEKTGTSFEVINAAICDRDGEVRLKTSTVYADKPISHARITSDGSDDGEHRTVPSMTLDRIVEDRELPGPFLLKVDVDGAELLVLKGAREVLKRTSVVVIETGFTNMVERAAALLAAGFEVFDVVDISYYNDRFVQADMVFMRTDLIRDRKLEVYRDGFDVAKWQPYAPANT